MSETLELTAPDGYRLGATLFPARSHSGRAVLINAATGVKQDYYARFASYLAERGFTVLTYDYRGIGRSRPQPLKRLAARMSDWATLDAAAALDCLEGAAPGARLMAIGHSFGGQALGLVPGAGRIAAALLVGSQSGYWRNWPAHRRPWMWSATHVVLPAVSRLLGYFPSSRLGLGEDLPAGVAVQWASWCRHPRYLVGALRAEAAYASFTAPLRAYAPLDDHFAPPRAVRALLELYPAAPSEMVTLAPGRIGAGPIGHFGFFRERFRDSLWRDAADWLARQ